MDQNLAWLEWARELQAIAQAGLHYSKSEYELERFSRVREISAEMMSAASGLPPDTVRELFCNETGYQTPKLCVRAAVFRSDKILLVKEKRTKNWALPGGWVDVNETVWSNTVKEVREEAGLEVKPTRLIAVTGRRKCIQPPSAYGICCVFVLCEYISGKFHENIETSRSGYFAQDALPELAAEKNTHEQVNTCFQAHNDHNWQVLFD